MSLRREGRSGKATTGRVDAKTPRRRGVGRGVDLERGGEGYGGCSQMGAGARVEREGRSGKATTGRVDAKTPQLQCGVGRGVDVERGGKSVL